MIDIVTLACSIKHNGFCLAGKTINEPHNWIRLVSDKDGKELDQNQIQVDGAQISPFDVLRIDETKKAPLFYQPENIIFDQTTTTRIQNDNIDLTPYLDSPDLLWGNKRKFRPLTVLSFLYRFAIWKLYTKLKTPNLRQELPLFLRESNITILE